MSTLLYVQNILAQTDQAELFMPLTVRNPSSGLKREFDME